MFNLRRLIREFVKLEMKTLSEGVIHVPEELIARAEDLYKWINDMYDQIYPVVYPDPNDIDPETKKPKAAYTYWHPTGHPELRNFFQIKRRDGTIVPVHVGLYGGHGSNGMMSANGQIFRTPEQIEKVPEAHFLINMDRWKEHSLDRFKLLVNHELAHALDPFLIHSSRVRKFKRGDLAEPDNEVTPQNPIDPRTGDTRKTLKYRKSQEEYAAEASSVVMVLKRVLRDSYRRNPKIIYDVVKMIADISTSYKKYSPVEKGMLYGKMHNKYESLIPYTQDFSEIFDLASNPYVLAWISRPSLWKKFIRDLTAELGTPEETKGGETVSEWIVNKIKSVTGGDKSKTPLVLKIINAVSAVPSRQVYQLGPQNVTYNLYNSKKFEDVDGLSQYDFGRIVQIVLDPNFKKNAPSPGNLQAWRKFLSDLQNAL